MKIIVHDGDSQYEAWIRKNMLKEGEQAEIITDTGTIKNCIGCSGC